jgi:hypothetical protein
MLEACQSARSKNDPTLGGWSFWQNALRHRKAADPPGKIWKSQPLNHCSYGFSTYHYDYLPVSLVPQQIVWQLKCKSI